MHAHRPQLVLHRVGERRVSGIGQHDRRAVSSQQREEFQARLDRRRLRENAGDVVGQHGLDIGDMAAAKIGELLIRQMDAIGCR